jgi:hypothetical protein
MNSQAWVVPSARARRNKKPGNAAPAGDLIFWAAAPLVTACTVGRCLPPAPRRLTVPHTRVARRAGSPHFTVWNSSGRSKLTRGPTTLVLERSVGPIQHGLARREFPGAGLFLLEHARRDAVSARAAHSASSARLRQDWPGRAPFGPGLFPALTPALWAPQKPDREHQGEGGEAPAIVHGGQSGNPRSDLPCLMRELRRPTIPSLREHYLG